MVRAVFRYVRLINVLAGIEFAAHSGLQRAPGKQIVVALWARRGDSHIWITSESAVMETV